MVEILIKIKNKNKRKTLGDIISIWGGGGGGGEWRLERLEQEKKKK